MGINPHWIWCTRRSCSFAWVLTRNALNFLAYEIVLSVPYPIHPGLNASHNAQNTIQCRDETQMFSIARVINVCSMHALVIYRERGRERERERVRGWCHNESLPRMDPIFLFLIRFTLDSMFVYNFIFHAAFFCLFHSLVLWLVHGCTLEHFVVLRVVNVPFESPRCIVYADCATNILMFAKSWTDRKKHTHRCLKSKRVRFFSKSNCFLRIQNEMGKRDRDEAEKRMLSHNARYLSESHNFHTNK